MYSFELLDCRFWAIRQRGVRAIACAIGSSTSQRGGQVLAADELAELLEPAGGLFDAASGGR